MATQYVFHLIGTAHIDPVWLWDWQEGLNEGLATCRANLNLLDEDPEVCFCRGEAAIYEHILRTDPAMFERIRAHVAAGRWEVVGGTYVQSDENLPDTEALMRQYTRGQQFFSRHLGKVAATGWSADCFGHSAGLPAILNAAGITQYCFTRPLKPECPLPGPAFWWDGPGGSRVLAYRPHCDWYCIERDGAGC
jgi:alpha-mannosidase